MRASTGSSIRRASSGSRWASSSSEPFTSAYSTVTCFRSPSTAARWAAIFSARCGGVWTSGAAKRSATDASPAAIGWPHPPQKRAPGSRTKPQRGHADGSACPHSTQKRWLDGFSVRQRGQPTEPSEDRASVRVIELRGLGSGEGRTQPLDLCFGVGAHLLEQVVSGPGPARRRDDPRELSRRGALEPATEAASHERRIARDGSPVVQIVRSPLAPPVVREAGRVHAVGVALPQAEEPERDVAESPVPRRRLRVHPARGHTADHPLTRAEEIVETAAEGRGIEPAHRPVKVTDCFLANATTPLRKSSVCPLAAMAWASSSIWVSRLSWVDWWKSSLARPNACVGPCASSRASAPTAPANSASGCTRLTSPHSIASRADSTRLV